MSRSIAIIGAGPGGYVAAIRGAQIGAKVTVIEGKEVGGTCLNRGCIPTKALLSSARVCDEIAKAEDYGVDIKGEISYSLKRMVERKNQVVSTLVKGIHGLFKSWGIELIEGRGSLFGEREVEVISKEGELKRVGADAIIIATGSNPSKPSIFHFDGKQVITSDEALNLAEIPKSLLIVGGGVIGCEFASLYRALGTEVTVVEMLPRLLATEDEEITDILLREFKKRGIKIFTGRRVGKVNKNPDGTILSTLDDGKEISSEKVLVSIGRSPNSDGLNLHKIGIASGKKGEIIVNERMETNIPGIYSIGDVTGGIMLAHVASYQGILTVENILGADRRMEYSRIPNCIFTLPEIGSIGLREHQAAEMGYKVRAGRFQFRALGKAHAYGEIAGMVKIITDTDSNKILGGHIIGQRATDLVHEIALAMRLGAKAEDIVHTIHAHPTFSEAVLEAAEDTVGRAIHVPRSKT